MRLLFVIFALSTTAFAGPEAILNSTGVVATTSSASIDLTGLCAKAYSVGVAVTNSTAAAAAMDSATDIDADTDTFTKASHGLFNGIVGRFTTSDTLPDGLAEATDYYVISATTNTFKVSATSGGAAVDLVDDGTGTQTFTPTALSATLKLQQSNDQASWVDVTNSSQNVTATGFLNYSAADVAFDYAKLVYTPAAGSVTLVARQRTKQYCGSNK